MKKNKEKKRNGKRFSARASLIAIGQFAKQWKIFDVIKEKVTIAQKVVKHTPIEKLTDAFVCILAGARGLYEVNKRVRSDAILFVSHAPVFLWSDLLRRTIYYQ